MIAQIDSWKPAPANLALSKDEVHVWYADLNQTHRQIQQLATSLSTDEQLRAERFRFEQHRQHFVVARGVLRAILSKYTGIEPNQVQFCYSSYGKPALVNTGRAGLLNFNLSHSGGVALYAVVCERQVGIDIEHHRPTDVEAIAKRFFSTGEYEQLCTVPLEQKNNAFFRYWTLKEAYIKATGRGLSLPLDQFEVSLATEHSAARLRNTAPQAVSQWSLQELNVGCEYAAAIAVEGDNWRLKCWHMNVERD